MSMKTLPCQANESFYLPNEAKSPKKISKCLQPTSAYLSLNKQFFL